MVKGPEYKDVTPDDFSETMFIWLMLELNSKNVKRVAKMAGYKISFFSPGKTVHLFEEMLFLHISLATHAAKISLGDRKSSTLTIVKTFMEKFSRTFLDEFVMKRDEEFSERYSAGVSAYLELLDTGADSIGISSEFLNRLFKTPVAGFEPITYVSIQISCALKSLVEILSQLKDAQNRETDTWAD